jgi:hypothetical protein
MAEYDARITVAAGPVAAFSYLADIANLAQWDPNVRSVIAVAEGSPGVGSKYVMTIGFYGKAIELTGEIVELDSPHRLVLGVVGGRVRGRYLITVAEAAATEAADAGSAPAERADRAGSVITYHVTLELRGAARVLNRGLQLALNGIGDNAVNGLRRRLDPNLSAWPS